MMRVVKILAVDDEADFELLITQRFRRQIRAREFDFRFARHGEEALAALAAEPDIDLMLLDINMPVMDGLTLLAELRRRRCPVRAVIRSWNWRSSVTTASGVMPSTIRVKPTMSTNSTATFCRRTTPNGSSRSARSVAKCGEK